MRLHTSSRSTIPVALAVALALGLPAHALPPGPATNYPTVIDADPLHDAGITGQGVTVAVIDSGVWEAGQIARDSDQNWRILGHYDAIEDVFQQYLPSNEGGSNDDNGHGTHISSVIVSSGQTKGRNKLFHGVAPDASLLSVKAFDVNGAGTYADVIRGIDWVVANKDAFDPAVRVLNLSFTAPARSYYWDDPLNQAVMRAWDAGLVVVAAAGDDGPGPLSVTVPGNVPYVITVGATSFDDPNDPDDDFLAPFSSAGPTAEAFVKPDLSAPGYLIRGILKDDQLLAQSAPYLGGETYELSGTSHAAAIVSGAVALMLQADPTLDPDTVKCRLIDTARPAVDDHPGPTPPALAYSVFQQGAGLVNAQDAVDSTQTICANQGLVIANDLDDTEHYRGLADQDFSGDYYLTHRPLADYAWDGTLQPGTFPFVAGFAWPGGFPFSDSALSFPFSGGAPDDTLYPWLPGLYPFPQVWTGSEPVTAGLAP